MTADELRAAAKALVERTRINQGLPPTITDRATLAKIAALCDVPSATPRGTKTRSRER